jgi:RNA polymerase sigma-70 factor, ECF subfamily
LSIYHKTSKDVADEIQDIERARANPRAFSVLYERYYRDIYLFSFRRIGDKDDTQDLVSQIFVKAMQNLSRYQHRGLPFSSWLFRIASNEVNLFFRKSKKNRCINIDDSGVERLLVEVEEYSGVDVVVIGKIMQYLKEDDVELLEMRYFEALSIREVSEILNISESNVKVKVFRLMEKIRKIVAKEGIGNNE